LDGRKCRVPTRLTRSSRRRVSRTANPVSTLARRKRAKLRRTRAATSSDHLVGKLVEMMNFVRLKCGSDVEIGRVRDSYLASDGFWGRARLLNKPLGATRSRKLNRDVTAWEDFREFAMTTSIPASEASAEHQFSILQYVFKKNRMGTLLDNLPATLAVRM
jgi:hypothetical protein